jgi:hypothetical protein
MYSRGNDSDLAALRAESCVIDLKISWGLDRGCVTDRSRCLMDLWRLELRRFSATKRATNSLHERHSIRDEVPERPSR